MMISMATDPHALSNNSNRLTSKIVFSSYSSYESRHGTLRTSVGGMGVGVGMVDPRMLAAHQQVMMIGKTYKLAVA